MKTFLLVCFLFLSVQILHSQDYKCIIPLQEQFFRCADLQSITLIGSNYYSWSQVKVAYFDSTASIANGSDQFTFHIWRDTVQSWTSQNCVIQQGPSWMGPHVVELNNGWTYFFNLYGDTIRVNTAAGINDSWHFYDFANGDFISAHLDSIVQMQQANILDSVKCISLSTTIPNHPANGLQLFLSKSNGFFRTVSYREFPETPVFLDRITNIPMPTSSQIYDFDVNDEFEYLGQCFDAFGMSQPPAYTHYKIQTKSFNANMDTVIYYRFFEENHIEHTSIPPYWVEIYSSGIDTVSYPYNSTLLFFDYPESNLPHTSPFPYPFSYKLKQDTAYFLNIPRYYSEYGYLSDNGTCWELNTFEPVFVWNEYAAGLGSTTSGSDYRSMASDICRLDLIWFNKGGQTWGTFRPINTGIDERGSQISISVMPNPVTSDCSIQFSKMYKGNLIVYDITGRSVIDLQVNDQFVYLDMSDIPKGLYVLSFQNETGITNKKIIRN